jgi:hypothetical protein
MGQKHRSRGSEVYSVEAGDGAPADIKMGTGIAGKFR